MPRGTSSFVYGPPARRPPPLSRPVTTCRVVPAETTCTTGTSPSSDLREQGTPTPSPPRPVAATPGGAPPQRQSVQRAPDHRR